MKNKWILLGLFIFLILWILLIFTDNIYWFDENVYNLLKNVQSDRLTDVMKIITRFANTEVIVLFCCISLVGLIWKKFDSLYLVLTMIISTGVNVILKLIFARARPEDLQLISESGYSFPSGHAMASMTFYGFMIYFVMNLKIKKGYKILVSLILTLLIFFIGISRVYLGVHYASDIVGGYIISLIILIIITGYIKEMRNESINNRSK